MLTPELLAALERWPHWVSECRRYVLVQGDCLEVLPVLPAGCVDAVVTDPVWPNVPEGMFEIEDTPQVLFEKALYRLPDGVKRLAVQIGCNSDPRFLCAVPWFMSFFRVCWLEYVRPNYLGRLLYTGDVAYLFGSPPKSRDGAHVIPGRCIQNDSAKLNNGHPCPRQLQHVSWIVKWWSSLEETILDPFVGSGTTLVACVRTDRCGIGIEREPKYFDIACKRVQDELDRHPLFAEERQVQRELL
jgi:DNA modification methylase